MSSDKNKQWANKKSRLYKNYSQLAYFKGVRERSSGGSKPEVSPRNTRHENWHKALNLSLLCIAEFIPRYEGHMPYAHTSGKNRRRIFLRPVPTTWKFTIETRSLFRNVARRTNYLRKDWPYKVLIDFQGRFLSAGH
jgi:hypothetical protein